MTFSARWSLNYKMGFLKMLLNQVSLKSRESQHNIQPYQDDQRLILLFAYLWPWSYLDKKDTKLSTKYDNRLNGGQNEYQKKIRETV